MLRIKGGKVYDPANNINGEVRDICISDGRIVADVPIGRTIDATGMIVFPGGVDVHTHVAGAALNFARAMIPEDHRRNAPFVRTPVPPRRHRRIDPDHIHHRLPLRRTRLHHRERGGRADPLGPAHPRGAARHAHRR